MPVIDLKERRMQRDLDNKPSSSELHIRWAGDAYEMSYVDYEGAPDMAWLSRQAHDIFAEHGIVGPNDEGKHLSLHALCPCGHWFMTVCEVGTDLDALECTGCGEMTARAGLFRLANPPEPAEPYEEAV